MQMLQILYVHYPMEYRQDSFGMTLTLWLNYLIDLRNHLIFFMPVIFSTSKSNPDRLLLNCAKACKALRSILNCSKNLSYPQRSQMRNQLIALPILGKLSAISSIPSIPVNFSTRLLRTPLPVNA